MKLPLRIVVADDELDMRDFFRRMLERSGHHVISVAENGRQLVQQCHELKPDLVISDVRMPEMDGLEAAATIFHERPVPVVLVSAHHDERSLKGMDHVMALLAKPFTYSELEIAIGNALRGFRERHPSSNGDSNAAKSG